MAEVKFWRAVNLAYQAEMRRDERVVMFGEDVGVAGGVFGVSRNLHREFGSWRVRDTPISENSIMGMAVGAAATGLRPILDIMYMDFSLLAMDQIVNQAAKYKYFSGGIDLPLVVTTLSGTGGPHGAQHSQSFEAWYASVPGFKVVMPSNGADAHGLLRAAIQHDGPVMFVATISLLKTVSELPDGDHVLPLGRADVKRHGDDLTIVSYGPMVGVSLAAAEILQQEHGIGCDVVDLRTLQPLDTAAILESVAKTGRLMIVHEAHSPQGIGAEVAAVVVDQGFDHLDAPIVRVTPPFINVPVSEELAALRRPSTDDVVQRAVRLVEKGS